MINRLKQDLNELKNPAKAKILARFFKTGKGEYGEGDIFLGITMPKQRQVVKKYLDLSLDGIEKLLGSEIHEYRMTGLLVLVKKYEKADDELKKKIFELYLRNAMRINNWDLVDLSSPQIVGGYLLTRPLSMRLKVFERLASSKSLWERRIGILACLAFIRKDKFEDILRISEMLLDDTHDLIHKAVGWMLREVGKRDLTALENFLKKHHKKMPRTMLRYAIERMSAGKRKRYLKK